jgi:hypothetical protein
LIEVVECAVKAIGNDSTTEVKNAYLRLRGALHPVTLIADGTTHDPVECSAAIEAQELDTVIDLDIPPATDRVDALFLPIFRRIWYGTPWLYGMILEPADGEIQGVYSRMGIFKVTGASSCKMLDREDALAGLRGELYERNGSSGAVFTVI